MALLASLLTKLSDSSNPGTVSVWVALPVAVLVVLLVWRALVPQLRALVGRRTTSRRHRSAMLARNQKNREGLPPGQY